MKVWHLNHPVIPWKLNLSCHCHPRRHFYFPATQEVLKQGRMPCPSIVSFLFLFLRNMMAFTIYFSDRICILGMTLQLHPPTPLLTPSLLLSTLSLLSLTLSLLWTLPPLQPCPPTPLLTLSLLQTLPLLQPCPPTPLWIPSPLPTLLLLQLLLLLVQKWTQVKQKMGGRWHQIMV